MFGKPKEQRSGSEKVNSTRIIYLSGKVDEENAKEVILALLKLQKEDPLKDITMVIDSYGGLIDSMFAITDTMNLIKPEVVTICVGKAMSAGAFIFANGQAGRRMMTPHSTLMFHQVSGASWGTTADVEIDVAEQKRLQNLMVEELSKRCNLSEDEVKKMIDRNNFVAPPKAMEIGICDGIITKLP